MADEAIILYHYAYSPNVPSHSLVSRLLGPSFYAMRLLTPVSTCYTLVHQFPLFCEIQARARTIARFSEKKGKMNIYLDTRLQLERLETLPATTTGAGPLGATSPEHTALQHLLSRLMTAAGGYRSRVAAALGWV